jgi:hypothetical protein
MFLNLIFSLFWISLNGIGPNEFFSLFIPHFSTLLLSIAHKSIQLTHPSSKLFLIIALLVPSEDINYWINLSSIIKYINDNSLLERCLSHLPKEFLSGIILFLGKFLYNFLEAFDIYNQVVIDAINVFQLFIQSH